MIKIKGLKVMQALIYIESRFNNLSLKVKIELFLLPLLIFLFMFYLIFEENSKIQKMNLNHHTFVNLKSIKMSEKNSNILNNIEMYAKKNLVAIKSISSDNYSIKIEVSNNKKEQIQFLKYLEDYNNFSKIDSISIRKNTMSLELVFKKVFIKNKIDISSRIDSLKITKHIKLTLNAIIGKRVYINKKWLTIGEEYEGYKLIRIDKKTVDLQRDNKRITLKVYTNEYN